MTHTILWAVLTEAVDIGPLIQLGPAAEATTFYHPIQKAFYQATRRDGTWKVGWVSEEPRMLPETAWAPMDGGTRPMSPLVEIAANLYWCGGPYFYRYTRHATWEVADGGA